jgi:hypothetical protein
LYDYWGGAFYVLVFVMVCSFDGKAIVMVCSFDGKAIVMACWYFEAAEAEGRVS